jgi:hypothetical protein
MRFGGTKRTRLSSPGSTQASITLNYVLGVGQGSIPHTMNLINGPYGTGSNAGFDSWDVLLSNGHVGEENETQGFGHTIAHEVGHILGFLHRGLSQPPTVADPILYDGLPTPVWNVMSIDPETNELTADRFDLAQAEAVQYSNAVIRSGT